jgi:hypothetical protein
MKLKLLLEGIHGKFWWMTPQGKLARVYKLTADTGHREAAIQFLQAMSITPQADVFKQMYDLGWLRIAYKGDRGVYVVEISTNPDRQPSARQLDALKDLATELDASEIRNTVTRQTYPFGIWE